MIGRGERAASTDSYFTENVTASIQSNKNWENTKRGNFCSRGGERSHMHVMKKRVMITFIHKIIVCLFVFGATAPSGLGPPHSRGV